jgi:hypothetical protein
MQGTWLTMQDMLPLFKLASTLHMLAQGLSRPNKQLQLER